jgi:MOSC domain-containing protein YiiM
VLPGAVLGITGKQQPCPSYVEHHEQAGVVDCPLQHRGGTEQPGIVAEVIQVHRVGGLLEGGRKALTIL